MGILLECKLQSMKKHIAFLRGINVSGQKKIKMAELRAQMEIEGFQGVQSYIQSGNLLFESDEASSELETKVKDTIRKHYGFEVPTLVVEASYLSRVLAESPFAKDPEKDVKRFYYTFLAEEPAPERLQALEEYDFAPEEYAVGELVVYFYSPNSYGRAKMSNNFFEKKLKVQATTRNLNTIRKMIALAQAD